jgi:hypothetical protein
MTDVKRWGFIGVMLVILAGVLVGCGGGGSSDAIAAGAGTLQLTVELPEGYHLNADTISRVMWDLDGAVVKTDAESDTEVTSLDEPITLPVTFAEGEAESVVHLDIKYCNDIETQCFIETKDLELPVQVKASGSRSILAASWEIVPPQS